METNDSIILGTILSSVYILTKLGDRLWKKGQKTEDDPPRAMQSIQCGFQHQAFQKSLDDQTDSLKEMVKALRDMVEDGKLRHQIVLEKLERIHEAVNHRPHA